MQIFREIGKENVCDINLEPPMYFDRQSDGRLNPGWRGLETGETAVYCVSYGRANITQGD